MTDEDEVAARLQAVTDAHEIAEGMGWVRQATAEHRDALVTEGFSSVAAERMAVQYHYHLLATIRFINGTRETS